MGKHTIGVVGIKTILAEIVSQNRNITEKRIGALIREKRAHGNYLPEMYMLHSSYLRAGEDGFFNLPNIKMCRASE